VKYLWTLLFLLPSCGLYQKMDRSMERIDQITDDANKALDGVKEGVVAVGEASKTLAQAVQEIKTEADLNKDGEVRGMGEYAELLYQLLALLGIAGYARGVDQKRSASIKALHEKLEKVKEQQLL